MNPYQQQRGGYHHPYPPNNNNMYSSSNNNYQQQGSNIRHNNPSRSPSMISPQHSQSNPFPPPSPNTTNMNTPQTIMSNSPTGIESPTSIPFSLSSIKSLQIAKVHKDNSKEINSINYSNDGSFLLTSSDDDTLVVYNVQSGERHKIIPSKKYGCSLARYTHSPHAAIYASKKDETNDDIRYLNIHTGSFIKYFKGHTGRVVSLEMCPTDDTFASSSLDCSVRLWDLRQPNGLAKLTFTGKPICSYDPHGLVLAVVTTPNVIKLYDRRQVDKGHFGSFTMEYSGDIPDYYTLQFSSFGKYIVVNSGDAITMLDAFKGNEIFKKTNEDLATNEEEQRMLIQNNPQLTSLPPPQATGISSVGPSFSPDEDYIVIGTEDGRILCLDSSKGNRVYTFPIVQSGNVIAKFNPKYMMMASACQNLCMWVPGMP